MTRPDYAFGYTYTGRNQLESVQPGNLATYDYDANGNLTTRTLANGTHNEYALDRVTWILNYLNGTGRTYSYEYYDKTHNRKYARRWITPADSPEDHKDEVFSYDLADQAIVAKLNVPS